MRWIAAIAAALFIAVVCVTLPAKATTSEAEPQKCSSIEKVIGEVKQASAEAKVGPVDSDVAKSIMATLASYGVPPRPYDQMLLVLWPNGKATVILFVAGCATDAGSFPASILGRDA